jgi:hypothetical protein
MKYNIFCIIIITLLFSNCVSYDNHNATTTQADNINSGNRNRNSNITAYTLARDETLAIFLKTQNSLNEYASHENVPTESKYRELFSEYVNLVNEEVGDKLDRITDKEKKEFEEESGLSFDVIDLFTRIGFMYKIEYNRETRIWSVLLIGRSTTLQIEMSQQRGKNMSYYHNVIPYINRWMELNNVSDLDYVLRIYINEIENNKIPELFGIPLGD